MTSQPPPYPGGNDFGAMPPYATGGGDVPGSQRTSGMAIAALVLGILSIPGAVFTIGLLGILLGILGIIFGIIGIRAGRRPGVSGKGMAIGGLVTAIIGLAVGGVLLGIYGNEYSKCSKANPGASREQINNCVRDNLQN